MGMEIARQEAVRTVDLASKTLSLTGWLLRSASGLTVGSEDVTREDGVKARRSIPTICRSLAPTAEQCREIESRIVTLRQMRDLRDLDFAMTKVTELLLSFASQAVNEQGAKARARGYITALDDLPLWAIADACRRWLRGEAGEQNYNFAPSPPVLRQITEESAGRLDGHICLHERLLSAKIVDDPVDYSEQHCEEMREKLGVLFKEIAKGKAA